MEDTGQGITTPLRPRRTITGMSAVLVPYTADGAIDWAAVEAHIARTHAAGLTPAVNMDTGYVQLLAAPTQERVLDLAAAVTGGAFVAGAYVADAPGAPFDLDAYARRRDAIASRGGTPVIFPSHGLNELDDDGWVDALDRDRRSARPVHRVRARRDVRAVRSHRVARRVPRAAWRSRSASAPSTPRSAGSSSGTASRSATRTGPTSMVLTGNDLAIDMVMYGSDYLLGLSTFAPEEFADPRPDVGRPATPASTSSTTCCSTSARSRSAIRCPATATTPRCGSSCAAGRRATRPRPVHPGAPTSDRAVLADDRSNALRRTAR